MRRNRSRAEIVVQILEVVTEGTSDRHNHDDEEEEAADGVIQTRIMYKALLRYAQLKDYLKVLTENDLITFDSASRKFKTTQKGLRVLEIYHKMGSMLKEEQDSDTNNKS